MECRLRAHGPVLRGTCSPCAAQVGSKLVISELLWDVCRATGAPPPVHAMDMGSSQRWVPMVLARRTPRGPPSLPTEPGGRQLKNAGVFLEVQGYPQGAQQRPLLATTVPSTIGWGMGAPCGGRRRPGERQHQRSKGSLRPAEEEAALDTCQRGGRRASGVRHPPTTFE